MLLNLCLAIGAMLSAIAAILAWLDARRDKSKATTNNQVAHQISDALTPVNEKLALLTQKLDAHIAGEGDAITAAVERGVQPLVTKIEVLETKVGVFWTNMALGAAKIIHQPDPRRAHIDALIDAFTEAHDKGEQLPADIEESLRGFLAQIIAWEPGQDIGFPVLQGEQAAALSLLHTMEHALPGPPESSPPDPE